jgi:glycosyltransferase involved in cell wall biosynthesis
MTRTSNMEIVVINDSATFNGGGSNVALQSAIGLADCGLPVTFFSAVGPVAPELQNLEHLNVVCTHQHEIADDPNRFRAFIQGIWNRTAATRLAKLLATKDPAQTIVHAHVWMRALSPAVLAVALDRGFRVTLTAHDFFAVCPSGGFFVHHSKQICQRTPLSTSCLVCNCDRRAYSHKLWRFARTALQNGWFKVASRIHHYIGVSQFSVDVIKPYLPPGIPVTIVRHPINCRNCGPAAVGENHAFVFVGRFSPEKGADLFADAASRANVPAIFVGGGELGSDLRQRCPHGSFLGWLPPRQITTTLRQARALVFPSLWLETLGLSAIEAMANGVPVIVSNCCAASAFVKNEVFGLHFQSGSVESLVKQMRRLSDRTFAEYLGRNAYDEYWKNPWTLESHTNELLSVYEQILGLAAVENG